MAVDIETEGEPLGRPRLLFEKSFPLDAYYDVANDGRFIYIEDASTDPPTTELVLVQNFFSELERLVPSR